MSIYLTLSMVPNTGSVFTPRWNASSEHDYDLLFIFTTNQMWNMFLSLFPHIWILQAFFNTTIVSSEENNFFQSSFVQFLFSWQKSIRVFLLLGLIKLFFSSTLFSKPISSPVILFRWLFPAWLSFIIERLVWKGISGDLRPHKLNDLLYKRQKVNTGMT